MGPKQGKINLAAVCRRDQRSRALWGCYWGAILSSPRGRGLFLTLSSSSVKSRGSAAGGTRKGRAHRNRVTTSLDWEASFEGGVDESNMLLKCRLREQ